MRFWIQAHQPVVDVVKWIYAANSRSAVATSPDSMSLNGTPFNTEMPAAGGMIQGNSGKIPLGMAFTLAGTDAADLVDLNLLVHVVIT